jgi:predicted MFS family arabinose efflux permease
MPFLVLGGIGLAYVLVLQYNLPRDTNSSAPRTQSVPFFPAAVEVLRLPAYQEMLVGFTATSIANWVIYTWLPLFVYERFSVGLASAGFSATFYLQVASFGGVLAGGWLADRWNRLATQAIGLLLAAPFLLLAASAGSLNLLIVALIAFGIGKGFYDANTMPVSRTGGQTRTPRHPVTGSLIS